MGRYFWMIFIVISVYCYADGFDKLTGSEMLFGSGAAMAGTSGAGTASASGIEAFYWNPACMANENKMSFSLNGNPGIHLNDFVLIVPGKRISFLPDNLTTALGKITRLRFKGNSGEDYWDGFALHMMDISMLDVGDNFMGKVDSNTIEYRLGLAWAFSTIPVNAGLEICYLQ